MCTCRGGRSGWAGLMRDTPWKIESLAAGSRRPNGIGTITRGVAVARKWTDPSSKCALTKRLRSAAGSGSPHAPLVESGQISGFIPARMAARRPPSRSSSVSPVPRVVRRLCRRHRLRGPATRKLRRSLIGYMPDTFGSYDNMRVGEYLDFFDARVWHPASGNVVEHIDEVLELVQQSQLQRSVRGESAMACGSALPWHER